MPTLFDPIKLGAITAPNRVVMAPLTRGRGTRDHVPTEIMTTYYQQRASAGLIISEATGISRQGLGWAYAPGIWNEAQIAAWQDVTQAVHAAGGRIVCQLWHMGRLVHPSFNDGERPVSASATRAPGEVRTYDGKQAYAEARALGTDEIAQIVKDYGRAAGHAIAAGFDGVQLHAANGYLIDQFLRDSSNLRDDAYGGPIANRIRFLREATEAVAAVVGPERTAVRLSPNGVSQGVNDSDPEPLFVAAAQALSEIGIAFLEVREPAPDSNFGKPEVPPVAPAIRNAFAGPLLLNSDFTLARAQAAIDGDAADAISFGRPFITNPDLVRRFELGLGLTEEANPTRWYNEGPEGYVDYPAAEAA